MLIRFPTAILAATLTLGGVLPASAQDGEPHPAVEARQSMMTVLAFNIGPLVAMAKGEMEYDAETATAAAENLARISALHQDRLWPEGTDNTQRDDTRALPAIWSNMGDFTDKLTSLNGAATDMAAVAGDGLDAVRANLGPVGDACGACHEDYRESD